MTAQGVPAQPAPGGRSLRRRVVRAVVVAVLALAAWRVLGRLVGEVDWPQVAAAFGHLDLWALPTLGVLLLVRQGLNAIPLVYYVPGLGWARSLQCDLAANLVGTFSPPPTDIVVRVRMFQSWGVDPALGMTGVTLNSAKFYAARFVAPLLGVLVLGVHEAQARHWMVAGLCALVTVAVLGALVLLLRSEGLAAWLGRSVDSVARRVRRTADPQRWERAGIDLRRRTAASLRRGLVPSMAALVAMTVADGLILAVALRAAGVEPSVLPWTEVLAAFLLVYPLTLLPLFGIGVLDAMLVGALVTVAGEAAEPPIVAAALVWRAVTILGTLALGLLAVGLWKVRSPDRPSLSTSSSDTSSRRPQ